MREGSKKQFDEINTGQSLNLSYKVKNYGMEYNPRNV
jgi:hypothetical protein